MGGLMDRSMDMYTLLPSTYSIDNHVAMLTIILMLVLIGTFIDRSNAPKQIITNMDDKNATASAALSTKATLAKGTFY
jgi:hypothetical protein